MARRKTSGLDLIASLPWPAGVALGIVAFLLIRYGIPWYLFQSGSEFSTAFVNGLVKGPLPTFSWVALLIFWVGAGLSFVKKKQRAKLFDDQAKNLELSSLSWRQFESLVAEWFERQGYRVTETGGGGPDGGIDLVLQKEGRKELVQCKHWKRRQVTVTTVREMWGLLDHHQADAVWIVCTGTFTSDAATFAADKPIHLLTGSELGAYMRRLKSPESPNEPSESAAPMTATPTCPRCNRAMVERENRRTGDPFYGCENYPACKGTLPRS